MFAFIKRLGQNLKWIIFQRESGAILTFCKEIGRRRDGECECREMKKGLQLDFRMLPISGIAWLVCVLCVYPGLILPEECCYENGWVENVQMIVLLMGGYYCLCAANHRSLFFVSGLVVLALILREVNCGRTLFFAKPGEINVFYRWSEIPGGWLVRCLYGGYMAWVAYFFLRKRLYRDAWSVLRMAKLPFWNVVLLPVSLFAAAYGERVLKNQSLEELSELVFYVSLVGLIYFYSRIRGGGTLQ